MNKRTRSIALIVTAIMLISLLVAFPAFKSTAADTNYALKSAGASYTIVSLAGSDEGDVSWLGNGNDSSFAALNDGVTNIGEVAGKYAGFMGTGKTVRIKFDLGAKKTGINKIVLQNMINNAPNGGNRGYVKELFAVSAGENTSAMNKLAVTVGETANGEKDSYEITIVFNAVDARYIWIEATSAVYVMTVDEVQIWASSSATVITTAAATTEPVAIDNNNYALAALGAKYVIASLVNGEEGDPAWTTSATYTDSSYTFLNNGKSFTGEIAMQSVALAGTGKTHRFKFDLGALKSDIAKIVIKNLINNTAGGGSRGYELSSIKVQAGASIGAMSNVTVSTSEKDNGVGSSFEVTLQFAAIDARYVYIDITSAAYVLSLDEIEIWGGEGGHVADPKFDLDASVPETVYAGDTVEVTIEAKNIKATNGLVGVDFVLTFDADKVTPLYTTDAQMTANFFAKNPSNRWEDAGCYYNASASQYNIRFADKDATTAYGIKADNTLVFKVAFTVKSTVAEGTTVKFQVKDVIGTDPGDASYNGFGDVDGNGESVSALVAKAPTTTTEVPTTTTEVKPPVSVVYGDVNNDGEVNALDASMCLKYDAGTIDLDDDAYTAADVNGDGEVNAMDASLILKYDAGTIDFFPVE